MWKSNDAYIQCSYAYIQLVQEKVAKIAAHYEATGCSMALIVLDSELNMTERRLLSDDSINMVPEFSSKRLPTHWEGLEKHYDCDIFSREWALVFVWVACGVLARPNTHPIIDLNKPEDAITFYSALCRAISRARSQLILFFDKEFYDQLKEKVPAFGGNKAYLIIENI